ncbi:MAG: class I SAM-dependent methyltransferase [Nitrospirae bacterium]|nr:class I SAM-dependent methyltransferase [Nitrospirota bacterium]
MAETRKMEAVPRIEWGAAEIGGPRHEYREGLLMGLAARFIPRGDAVLDAGCGGGSLLLKMAAAGYRMSGIEGSDRFVGKVRDRIVREGFGGRCEVRQGDLAALPFESASFDAVVAAEVLEHVPEDGKAVGEFFRVLKKGGVCLVSVPAHPELWDFTDVAAGHVRRYERTKLIDLFEKRGFRVERVLSWGFPFARLYSRYFDLPSARRKASSGGGGVDHLPDGGRYPFLTSFLKTIFRIDSLFGALPWGIGWLLVARKV